MEEAAALAAAAVGEHTGLVVLYVLRWAPGGEVHLPCAAGETAAAAAAEAAVAAGKATAPPSQGLRQGLEAEVAKPRGR